MQKPRIGTRALIPNPALKPLEVLVGTWQTEGSHGMLPGVTLQGNTSFEWLENGAFLLMRSEITNDDRIPDGIAIFGSDDAQRSLFMLYFDERGVSRMFGVRVEHNVITWWRDQPNFSQHSINTVSSDGKNMVSKGEICLDDTTWKKDLELTYTRIN